MVVIPVLKALLFGSIPRITEGNEYYNPREILKESVCFARVSAVAFGVLGSFFCYTNNTVFGVGSALAAMVGISSAAQIGDLLREDVHRLPDNPRMRRAIQEPLSPQPVKQD